MFCKIVYPFPSDVQHLSENEQTKYQTNTRDEKIEFNFTS